jgi:hypothetical protein
VFAQIYDGTLTNAFQKIELTIRGDPYWLGQTNLERQILLQSNGPTHDAESLPDGSSGRPTAILYFRYPLQQGDDFKPILKDSVVFNGIYEINRTINTFAEGAFKQVLHGTRLPLLNMDRAFTTDPKAVGKGQSSRPMADGPSQPDGGNTPGTGGVTPAAPGSTPLTPNVIAMHDQLISKGYSENEAAGILGYARGESGPNLDTNAYNPAGGGQGAMGIPQWRGSRITGFQAANDGLSPRAPLANQVDYIDTELKTTESKAGAALHQTTTAAQAGSVMLTQYGRPKASEASSLAAQRAGFAESYAKQFAARRSS